MSEFLEVYKEFPYEQDEDGETHLINTDRSDMAYINPAHIVAAENAQGMDMNGCYVYCEIAMDNGKTYYLPDWWELPSEGSESDVKEGDSGGDK